MTNQPRRKHGSGSKGSQNSYRKSPDSAGQNPERIDIQQPGKAGDFGNGERHESGAAPTVDRKPDGRRTS